MNDGVKILLERMQTHPEEFLTQEKWSHLIQSHKMFLSDEDRNALENALNGLMQQRFTERVMEELVDPKKSDNWADSIMQAKGITSATPTLSPSIPSITMTPSLRETLNTLEEIKKQYEPKQSKTLFGKLFNYA